MLLITVRNVQMISTGLMIVTYVVREALKGMNLKGKRKEFELSLERIKITLKMS